MMKMIKNIVKNKIKKKIIHIALLVIKPFIIPIIIICLIIFLVSSITDILYISFEDDNIDMTKEFAYYNTTYEKENDEEAVKGFFTSVFDFIGKIFGGEMCEETDWPVERTLYNKQWIWEKRFTYSRSIYNT